MKKFKAQGLLAVLVLSVAITGCGVQGKSGNQTGSNITEPTATVTPSPEPTTVPNEREAIIYLTDSEGLETVEYPVKLSYETNSDLVKAAVSALQQDGGENATSIWKPIEVKSVELVDDKVTVDIHLPDEARLGAPGEILVIESLKKTLFQFDFVNSIELLADGEAIDTLMGHVELEHPMIRE